MTFLEQRLIAADIAKLYIPQIFDKIFNYRLCHDQASLQSSYIYILQQYVKYKRLDKYNPKGPSFDLLCFYSRLKQSHEKKIIDQLGYTSLLSIRKTTPVLPLKRY